VLGIGIVIGIAVGALLAVVAIMGLGVTGVGKARRLRRRS